MTNSKDQHPAAGSPPVRDTEAQEEALRAGASAVQGAGVVRAVPDAEPADDPELVAEITDPAARLSQTGGRNTTIRQVTFNGQFRSLVTAINGVKDKALSFGERVPELRLEITGNAEQGFTANALLTFTDIHDDPQAALVG